VEIIILEDFQMIRDMDMEKCIGQMEIIIKDNGSMVFNMD
jgi:hypothetical protein